jgi:uncharacterized protein YegJ (DUF2314 family)
VPLSESYRLEMATLTRHALVTALLFGGAVLTGKADNPTSGERQSRSGEPEVYRVENQHAAMRKAVDQARKTVSQFIKAVQHPAAGQTDFEVKKPFVQGNEVEHIWLSDVEFVGGRFKGKVDNAPVKVHGLKMGQVVSVNPDEISDWAYVDNGKLIGGYTIRAHYNELTPAEQKEFQRQADFKLE